MASSAVGKPEKSTSQCNYAPGPELDKTDDILLISGSGSERLSGRTAKEAAKAQGRRSRFSSDAFLNRFRVGVILDHFLDKGYVQERRSNAGRKRIDPLILFRCSFLQHRLF